MSKKKDREWNQLKEEYHNMKIPENGLQNMKKAIERAESEKSKRKKILLYKRVGSGVAAALVIAVLLPNVSADVAMAMERVPILRDIVKVVTLGRYNYEDERHEANVEIPRIELVQGDTADAGQDKIAKDTEETAKGTEETAKGTQETAKGTQETAKGTQEAVKGTQETVKGADEIAKDTQETAKRTVDTLNKEMEAYINPLVEDFKAGLEEDAVKTLDISYEVVTDTDAWFTLRIDVLEIQASGYMYSRYYHIDKTTGERAVLKDLFRPDADYTGIISENIKEQMREQMAEDEGKIYFLDNRDMPDGNFDRIREDQNFYFNESGELVIAFDEYEVAPGYMGPVLFTIPKEVTKLLYP